MPNTPKSKSMPIGLKIFYTIASVICALAISIAGSHIYTICFLEPYTEHLKIENGKDYLFQKNEINSALKSFNEATDININSEQAWFYKGVALMKDKKFGEAINSFNATIKINPNNINALFNIGVCYESLADRGNDAEKYEDALNSYWKANNKSQDGIAWSEIGRINQKLNRSDEAEYALNKARERGYGYNTFA